MMPRRSLSVRAGQGPRELARLVIMGQAPGKNHGFGAAFEGPTGRRLARFCGFDTVEQLRERALLVNLWGRYPGRAKWVQGDAFPPTDRAKRAAARRRAALAASGCEVLVCCGRIVATSFGVGDAPFLEWREVSLAPGKVARTVVVPHPSGVSRWWQDPASRGRASALLTEIVGAEVKGVSDGR